MSNAKKQTELNTFRFMPGATPADGKILRGSLRYAENAFSEAGMLTVGIGIGPGVRVNALAGNASYNLSDGGVIIPIRAENKEQIIQPRPYKNKKYIDFASFIEKGPGIIAAIQCNEERTFYVEVWTGDTTENAASLQVIQSGFFKHGSIAFSGGDIVVDTSSQKPASTAAMMSEKSGPVVGGVALWNTRLWRIKHSSQDSEAVLVRQLDRFYLVEVQNGGLVYEEVPATKYQSRYERLAANDFAQAA